MQGYEEYTIAELLLKMQQHCLTSEQLTSWYLARIEQFDAGENGLNSVLEKNPDALAIAKQRDLERSQGRLLGPLHGIPVLIKDNIDTADKMHTSAGSLALANSYAGQDAKIVSRLRKAGAVLLGKTNMTEMLQTIFPRKICPTDTAPVGVRCSIPMENNLTLPAPVRVLESRYRPIFVR